MLISYNTAKSEFFGKRINVKSKNRTKIELGGNFWSFSPPPTGNFKYTVRVILEVESWSIHDPLYDPHACTLKSVLEVLDSALIQSFSGIDPLEFGLF